MCMHSKNKPAMTKAERAHVDIIKNLPCIVCGSAGFNEAHEIEQGLWFLSLPLCHDCHRGAKNGLHGQRAMWKVMKKTELSCLNELIETILAAKAA